MISKISQILLKQGASGGQSTMCDQVKENFEDVEKKSVKDKQARPYK